MDQASTEFQKALALGVQTPTTLLEKRQQTIDALRKAQPRLKSSWNQRFERAAAIEAEIGGFFKKSSSKEDAAGLKLEEDAIGQLTFQHWALKPLNHLPFVIAAVAIFKVWLVPILTVATPLLAWILPYLLLKFVYSLPISQSQYFGILRTLWTGQMGAPLPGPDDPIPSLFSTKSLMQFAVFGFSFLQSIIQPIQNAIHLRNTDRVFCDLGSKLLELREIVRGFRQDLARLPKSSHLLAETLEDALDPADPRRGFFLVVDEPQRLSLVCSDLARLEILWRIAAAESNFKPVTFSEEDFHLEGLADLSLGCDPVKTSVSLQRKSQAHAVITGPNGGGKSSFLRAILQAVLLANSYGYSSAGVAVMPRFKWIASGLGLRDTPGVYSMFETEVKFAGSTLRQVWNPSAGAGLVLFDELFHSTNPPDGIRTAERFLHSLWGGAATVAAPIFSIVSTHVFSLIESAPKTVQAICCNATESAEEITYKYSVDPGICKVSSVKKVWQRFGLAGVAAATRSRG